MKILAIDIGAGTQDILFYNTKKEVENSIKLVLPSPTVIIAEKIKKETAKGNNLYFDGTIMGGGKIKRAIIAHMEKGLDVAMEKQAAKTIKDDLTVVKNLGVEIVETDTYKNDEKYLNYSKISLKDIDIDELSSTIAKYDINFNFDEIAVAAQDHGFNENLSDRNFRFEKIREKLTKPLPVEDFAFFKNIPEYYTRMKAIEDSLGDLNPIVMDSKFASVCGACEDSYASNFNSYIVMDIGNGHTMVTSIEEEKIHGVFEHHTSSLTPKKIKDLIEKLANGTITHKEVHDDNGHGAHVIKPISAIEKVIVTGPRRKIIEKTDLDYYNASPGGDVMMTGPIGLIKAVKYLKEKNRI